MRRFWQHRSHETDAGFGLIEMVVALLLAGMVFGALAATLIASVRTSLLSRQNQQAADFMTQAVEDMRLLDYGSLSVDAGPLSGGPVGLGACSVGVLGAALDGPSSCYPLVQPASGTIAGVTAVSTLVGDNGTGNADTNNTTFTLYRYVTEVPGQAASAVRRVSVYIRWQLNGATHTRSTSTVISYSQRGLPVPYFALKESTGGVCVNPTATVIHVLTLENKGAPDRWNLTLTFHAPAASLDSSNFVLYGDTDHSGDYTPGTDQPLVDTSGDVTVDTGRIDPGTTFRFFLVRPTTATTTLGSHDVTVTATSVAQPTATTAVQHIDTQSTVQSGVCTSPSPSPSPSGTPSPTPTSTAPPLPVDAICAAPSPIVAPASPSHYTSTPFYLRNNGLTTSAVQTQLNLNGSAPTATSLGAYSTDVSGGAATPGRLVSAPTPAVTSAATLEALTDRTTFIDWSRDFGNTFFSGNGVLHLWVANATPGSAPAGILSVAVYATGSGGAFDYYTTAAITSTCAGFQEIGIPLTLADYHASGSSTTVHVRVTASAAVRFGYDTTALPAVLVVNTK